MRSRMMVVCGAVVLAGFMLAGQLAWAADAQPAAVDKAAKAAVAFLKGQQRATGSFGQRSPDTGITGLVLYGLARSPAVKSPDAEEIVQKAVGYLLKNEQDDGSINNQPPGLGVYRTSIAVLALKQIDPKKYKTVIRNGQKFLAGAQVSEANGKLKQADWQYGGWSYEGTFDAKGKMQPDLSNLQFAVSALKDSGLPETDEAYKRAVVFLQRCQNRSESNDTKTSGNDGGGFYTPNPAGEGMVTLDDGTKVYPSYGSMTYALLKSYLFCGLKKNDPRAKAAYDWIVAHYSVDENPGVGQKGLYYYLLTMAETLTAMGIDTVKTADGREHNWRDEMLKKVLSLQKADGSWGNEQDRWMEGDTSLVTGYALALIGMCGGK